MSGDIGLYPSPSNAPAWWPHTQLRRRLLSGNWSQDLERKRAELLDPTVHRIQGQGVVAKNVLRTTIEQLATLHNDEALVDGPSAEASARMVALLGAPSVGLPQLMIRHHRYVVGLRESLLTWRIIGTGKAARPAFRLVTPDMVEAWGNVDEPDVPHRIHEYRVRTDPKSGKPVWTRDVWSIEDLNQPYFRVEYQDGTPFDAVKPIEGEAYLREWSWTQGERQGQPYLPWEITHAERTGKLFDSYEGAELVEGALIVGVLFSFWNHVIRDCSWPQKYGINVKAAGARRDEKDEGLAYIPTDPNSIILFVSSNPQVQAVLSQFAVSADPEVILRAICDYAALYAIDYGVAPSDIQRTTGNAQSGWAVQLTRDGIRNQQKRFAPEDRRSYQRVVEKVAAGMNRAGAEVFPEDEWRVRHRTLQLNVEEERGALERHKMRFDMGLASKVTLLMEMDNLARPAAEERILQVNRDNYEFSTITSPRKI